MRGLLAVSSQEGSIACGAGEIEIETETEGVSNYVAIPTDTTHTPVGRAAQGIGRLSENGGSSFSESPLRPTGTSPIDGGRLTSSSQEGSIAYGTGEIEVETEIEGVSNYVAIPTDTTHTRHFERC